MNLARAVRGVLATAVLLLLVWLYWLKANQVEPITIDLLRTLRLDPLINRPALSEVWLLFLLALIMIDDWIVVARTRGVKNATVKSAIGISVILLIFRSVWLAAVVGLTAGMIIAFLNLRHLDPR